MDPALSPNSLGGPSRLCDPAWTVVPSADPPGCLCSLQQGEVIERRPGLSPAAPREPAGWNAGRKHLRLSVSGGRRFQKAPVKPCLNRGHRSLILPREPGLGETWRAILPPAVGWGNATLRRTNEESLGGGPSSFPLILLCGRVPRHVVLGEAKGGRPGRLESSLTAACLPKIKPWILPSPPCSWPQFPQL